MAVACVTVPLGPACVDITGVRAGDRNLFTATLSRKGVPIDLTGQTLTAQARFKSTSTDHLDAIVTVTDAAAGEVSIRWPGDDVSTWLAGKETKRGVWDLQVDNGIDDPVTVAAGAFYAESDVTR